MLHGRREFEYVASEVVNSFYVMRSSENSTELSLLFLSLKPNDLSMNQVTVANKNLMISSEVIRGNCFLASYTRTQRLKLCNSLTRKCVFFTVN